jgi:hypothetical protein
MHDIDAASPKPKEETKTHQAFAKTPFCLNHFSALCLSLNECFTPSSSLSFGRFKFCSSSASEHLHF